MLARVLALTVTAAAITAAALAGTSPAARAAPGGGNCGASGYPWGYDISCQTETAAPERPAGASPPPPGPSARRAGCTRSRETRTICCRSARTG